MIFDFPQFITTILVQSVIYFGTLSLGATMPVACILSIAFTAIFMKPYLRKK